VLQPLVGADRQLGVYDSAVGLVDGSGPTSPDAFTRLALAGEFARDGRRHLVAAVPVWSTTTARPMSCGRGTGVASRTRIERALALSP
jgi:hypothetical protein